MAPGKRWPMCSRISTLLLVSFGASALAQNVPEGYSIPEFTVSPDHRYGVTVPLRQYWLARPDEDWDSTRNRVVDLQTGRVLAVIQAHTGWDHMNHNQALPARWSQDGSLLLWTVDGKWFPDALVLLKLEKGQVVWQVNILKAAQEEVLARTKKAAPEKYAAAKDANKGNGAAYPEGFTVDVVAMDPVAFPLRIRVVLTSNPKQIEGFANLDSSMEAIVDSRGTFVIQGFHLEHTNVYNSELWRKE